MKSVGHGIRSGMVFLAIVFFSSCEKPKLKSDTAPNPGEEEKKIALQEEEKSIPEIRKAVIGRTFETLTLGSRQFVNARVQDITDRAIIIAHGDGVDEVSWSEVPLSVRVEWGYDPSAVVAAEVSRPEKGVAPSPESPGREKAGSPAPSGTKTKTKSKASMREWAQKIAGEKRKLDAQLAGIQSLESDLARQTQPLNELRRQLQAVKSQQSAQGSSRLRVKMIGGSSTIVDRKKEAAELEGKIKVQEQLVAQLAQSLQAARRDYDEMKAAFDRLQRQ